MGKAAWGKWEVAPDWREWRPKIKRRFYVTGYTGEGAKRMLKDLQDMENVTLIDKVIENRLMRFLYYRLDKITVRFQKWHFIKKLFYPWFHIMRIHFKEEEESCILFFNSGFCHELDRTVVDRLKKKKNLKLILYIVDPIAGFCMPEHWDIMKQMDLVLAINKGDCEKYGFYYYPLIYSKDEKEVSSEVKGQNKEGFDVYYLGSGTDRTELLTQISRKCKKEGIRTDFHVLCGENRAEREEIVFHKEPVSYSDNINMLLRSNCILEIMHKDFDNPTQRYSEAVVYNKKLLTNNPKITDFDFYNPQYMQVFHSLEEINMDFIRRREEINYGYQNEFSPRLLVQEIAEVLDECTREG